MQSVIIPFSWFGSIEYYAIIEQAEKVYLEKNEYFVKQSIRNTCTIMGANGPQKLSVPIKGRNKKIPFSEMQIEQESRWKAIQWNAICSAYKRSPYFEFYEDRLKSVFELDSTSLMEMSLRSINTCLSILKINQQPIITEFYQKEIDSVLDLRNKDSFKHTQLCSAMPVYFQVFNEKHPFTPNLSILDLICNKGPQAKNYLQELQLL